MPDSPSVIDSARAGAAQNVHGGLDKIGEVLDFRLLHTSGLEITIGSVVGAVLVIAAVLAVSYLCRRALDRYARGHASASRATLYTLSRLTHYVLLGVGSMIALSVAGIPVSRFAVFAGALGVGLGFGLQAIFNNFVSGLILLFERTMQVGDFVEISSGVHGTVQDIHIRATRITTNDNMDILVPNSEFVNGKVVNWTLRDVSRRLKVPFRVAYGTDKERVKQAALEAAAEVPFTLTLEGDRKPQVWLTSFGDSALNFSLVVWLTAEATKRPSTVIAAYNWVLDSALRRHDIEVPYPQRDLNVRTWFGRSGDAAQAEVQEVPQRMSPADASLAENDAVRDAQREIAEQIPRPQRDDNNERR